MNQESPQVAPEQPQRHSGGEPQLDAASKSLYDALRLSFRLLSIIMVLVLAALMLTGLSQIQTGQRGVKLLFGRIQGKGKARVVDEGLQWSWPEPLGRVVKVHTGERKLMIDDFWYHETPELQLKPEDIPQRPNEGLRPGYDGALLTGDRALIHVKFTCNYRVGVLADKPDADAIIEYVSNAIDPEVLVRSAVCNAAIHAAATQTVDSILTTGKESFRQKVNRLAQQRLDEMKSGIRIESVLVGSPRVPLAAISAFNAVNSARQEEQSRINQAIGEANRILEQTAGSSWRKLIEEPNNPDSPPGLLQQYAQARDRGDPAAAEALLTQIDRILMSNETTGSAAGIINDAKKYSASIRQRVASRANHFEQLIGQYEAAPELMLQRLWAETKEAILTSPTVVKYYLTPSEKIILRINQDPEVTRRVMEEMLKVKREQEQAAQGQTGK